MKHATFFIPQTQYDWLAAVLPQPAGSTGRPAIPNNELLNGILFVLKTGCRWQDIPMSVFVHGYSSCWRRLRFWQKHCSVRYAWQRVYYCYSTKKASLTSVSAIWTVPWSRLHNTPELVTTASTTVTARISHCSQRKMVCHCPT